MAFAKTLHLYVTPVKPDVNATRVQYHQPVQLPNNNKSQI
jgi:hypothetical protein